MIDITKKYQTIDGSAVEITSISKDPSDPFPVKGRVHLFDKWEDTMWRSSGRFYEFRREGLADYSGLDLIEVKP